LPTPSLTIDIVPIVLLVSALVSAASLAAALRVRRGPLHLVLWAVGGLLVSVSVLLIILRGFVPDFISILVGNLGAICGYVALSAGTNIAAGRRFRSDLWAGLACGAIFTAVYAAGGDLDQRVIAISIPVIYFSAAMARNFITVPALRTSRGGRLAIAALVANVAMSALRVLVSLGLFGIPELSTLLHLIVLGLGTLATMAIAAALATMSLPIRRGQPAAEPGGEDVPQSWQLRLGARTLVTPVAVDVRLTGNEYLLLAQFIDRNEGPVTRDVLNAAIGRDAANLKDRSVDIIISRLRRKCQDAGTDLPVMSVRGQGYVFHGELRGTPVP